MLHFFVYDLGGKHSGLYAPGAKTEEEAIAYAKKEWRVPVDADLKVKVEVFKDGVLIEDSNG